MPLSRRSPKKDDWDKAENKHKKRQRAKQEISLDVASLTLSLMPCDKYTSSLPGLAGALREARQHLDMVRAHVRIDQVKQAAAQLELAREAAGRVVGILQGSEQYQRETAELRRRRQAKRQAAASSRRSATPVSGSGRQPMGSARSGKQGRSGQQFDAASSPAARGDYGGDCFGGGHGGGHGDGPGPGCD